MAAVVLSPHAASPSPTSPHAQHQRFAVTSPRANELPPLVTSPTSIASPTKAAAIGDEDVPLSALSLTRTPLSNYSHSPSPSRPTSTVFPLFHTSLSYALVRDFAYPAFNLMHYGPLADTPTKHAAPHDDDDASHRLSDPPPLSWESAHGLWSTGGSQQHEGPQLPSTSFTTDSDEEYASQTSFAQRKSRSVAHPEEYARGRRRSSSQTRQQGRVKRGSRNQVPGLNSQGLFEAASHTESEDDAEQYHPRGTNGDAGAVTTTTSTLPNRSYHHTYDPDNDPPTYVPSPTPSTPTSHQHTPQPPFGEDSSDTTADADHPTSTDESFAGPSLALYDFKPENNNELALREGQIVQVGYRHGQGWLVAMDLDTGEQGLVPEEYVRLLSDLEGWGEEDLSGEGDLDDYDDDETRQQERERSGSHHTDADAQLSKQQEAVVSVRQEDPGRYAGSVAGLDEQSGGTETSTVAARAPLTVD